MGHPTDIARQGRRVVVAIVSLLSASALTASCGGGGDDLVTSTGAELQSPKEVGFAAAEGDRFLLLPGTDHTLVVQTSQKSTTVHVIGSEPDPDADLAVPAGFVPSAAQVVEEAFFLLGPTCDSGGECTPTLLRAEEGDMRWRPVPLPSDFPTDGSLVDTGEIDGHLFVAPGTGSSPAAFALDGDRWTSIPQPEDSKGAPTSICSTRSRVYKFVAGDLDALATGEPAAYLPDERVNQMNVWAWNGSDWDRMDPKADWDFSLTADRRSFPPLCGRGELVINRDASGKVVVVAPTEQGQWTQSDVDLPDAVASEDQALPPAALAEATGEILWGSAVVQSVESLKGATLLASAETIDDELVVLALTADERVVIAEGVSK